MLGRGKAWREVEAPLALWSSKFALEVEKTAALRPQENAHAEAAVTFCYCVEPTQWLHDAVHTSARRWSLCRAPGA